MAEKRNFIVYAELSAKELEVLRDVCRRQQRSTGFVAGQKMAIGYGATYPAVARDSEQYEVVTVTAIGKPGTQAYLAADAPAGTTNIKVTSVSEISAGDKIRLDIDSRGHGVETVTVTRVGSQANHTNLAADEAAGVTNIKVRNVNGFAAGDKITIGTPANKEEVTVTTVGTAGPTGTGIELRAGSRRWMSSRRCKRAT